MVEIIALEEYRQRSLVTAGFKRWRSRYDQSFHVRTGLRDLVPATLFRLSTPGGEAVTDLYSLIIGFLGHGSQVEFDDLDSEGQTRVLDIHLFLSDQIRFEMMQRLGWLERFAGNRFPLLEMVTDFERVKQSCLRRPPALARDHPGYLTYCPLYALDQQVFLRRLFPSALEAFRTEYNL